jgi:hypothetical protein
VFNKQGYAEEFYFTGGAGGYTIDEEIRIVEGEK